MLPALQATISQYYKFRFLVYQLVRQNLLVRYRRTCIGFLWTILLPLCNMTVISVVFAMVTRTPLAEFVPFIFSGLVPWMLFSNLVVQAGASILLGEGLIRKVYVPTIVFPIASSVSVLIDSVLSMLTLFLLVLFLPEIKLSSALLFIPVAILLVYLFALGLGFVFSVLFVYFRDLQQVIGIFIQLLFYISPIVYPDRFVPQEYHWIFNMNPIVHFLRLFRDPLTLGVLPPLEVIVTTVAYALGSIIIGLAVFHKYDRQLVFRL